MITIVVDFPLAAPAKNLRPAQMRYVDPARKLAAGSSTNGVAIAAGLIVFAAAFVGPNLALVAYAAIVLTLGLSMLWRPGEPPVMMFVFLYQWLQAAMGPIYGNLFGLRLSEMVQNLGDDSLACFLELTGTLVLAVGMRLAVGSSTFNLLPKIQLFVAKRPIGFWFRLYLGTAIFGAACNALAYNASGLTQLLLSLAQVKWAAYVLLTFATFAVPGRSKFVWIGVSLLEFSLAIGGFFSTFKDVFFYGLFGVIGSGLRFRPRTIFLIGCAVLTFTFFGVVWSAVKQDYRDFVSSGYYDQSVNVSYGESIQYLGSLIGDLDGDGLAVGVDKLAQRTMYFEFFGAALDNVPTNVPHANGAIWGSAILRTFMPRLIFSDKAPVHDSELTRQYTGIRVSSYDTGTSISMGYIAEAYIDFGSVLMFLPILLLGAGLGYIYRRLVSVPGRNGVLGAALSTFTLMQAYALETSVLKLIPGIGLSLLACVIILKFLAPLIWGVEAKTAAIGPGIRPRST